MVTTNANFPAFTRFSPNLGGKLNIEITQDPVTLPGVGSDVDVKELFLITAYGEKVDLKGAFRDIEIVEDMFSASIEGVITIEDTGGGLEKFAIRGGETIGVKIAKPKSNDIIIWRKDLILHKISESVVDQTTLSSVYQLQFVSRTFVNSTKKCLFKSYKNMSIGDAVSSMFSEIGGQNDLVLEDPRITLEKPFISTGLMPHKAIEAMTHRACAKGDFYVFFERLNPVFATNTQTDEPFTSSYYFGSLGKLIADSAQFGVYNIKFSEKLLANQEDSTIRTLKYERRENFNHLNAMLLGLYNTTITSIDPISRTHAMKKLSYANGENESTDFYSFKTIDNFNIFSRYDDVAGETPGRKLITSSLNDSVNRDAWLANNIYGHLSKNLFQIGLEIEGGKNNIGVGHIVNFSIHSSFEKLADPLNANPPNDKIYSGKYFVVAVTHKISLGEYTKSLELSRASVPYDFNTGLGSDQIESILPNRRYADNTESTTIVDNYWRKGLIPWNSNFQNM